MKTKARKKANPSNKSARKDMWMSQAQIAEILGVTKVVLYRWLAASHCTFPRGVVIGRRLVWHRQVVDKWLLKHVGKSLETMEADALSRREAEDD